MSAAVKRASKLSHSDCFSRRFLCNVYHNTQKRPDCLCSWNSLQFTHPSAPSGGQGVWVSPGPGQLLASVASLVLTAADQRSWRGFLVPQARGASTTTWVRIHQKTSKFGSKGKETFKTCTCNCPESRAQLEGNIIALMMTSHQLYDKESQL